MKEWRVETVRPPGKLSDYLNKLEGLHWKIFQIMAQDPYDKIIAFQEKEETPEE